MKIIQVVTYISPDGAYGGPVRVAINQAKALRDLGHEVILAAAAGGFTGPLPGDFDGFPVRLFQARRIIPKSGFAGLAAPGLLKWLMNEIQNVDVVHVHMARDLVTLPAALVVLLARKPLVVQTHGMIDHTNKKLAIPLDLILTQPILRRARQVFYLTKRERAELAEMVNHEIRLMHLPNGLRLPDDQAIEQVQGPQSNPEILFLARLHSRKRPVRLVSVAKTLEHKYPDAVYSIVGPDEGEAQAVQNAIVSTRTQASVKWTGAIPPERTTSRMVRSSIYVLPSVDEPFPMSVLEAMSVGLPVIVTETCGLAETIRSRKAGLVVSDTAEDLTRAIADMLEKSDKRIEMGREARRAIKEVFRIEKIAMDLIGAYNDAAYKNTKAGK